jgi:hypothetical protein
MEPKPKPNYGQNVRTGLCVAQYEVIAPTDQPRCVYVLRACAGSRIISNESEKIQPPCFRSRKDLKAVET